MPMHHWLEVLGISSFSIQNSKFLPPLLYQQRAASMLSIPHPMAKTIENRYPETTLLICERHFELLLLQFEAQKTRICPWKCLEIGTKRTLSVL